MWQDPIVEEVRRARDAYAAQFQGDFAAMFRDLQEKQRTSGRKIVSYAEEPQQPVHAESDQNPQTR